jgi:hypothetical protein
VGPAPGSGPFNVFAGLEYLAEWFPSPCPPSNVPSIVSRLDVIVWTLTALKLLLQAVESSNAFWRLLESGDIQTNHPIHEADRYSTALPTKAATS